MDFPLYRKYANEKSYFKIDSSNEFIELKLIGKTFVKYSFNAAQYPEKIMIQDLIANGVIISENEFNVILSKAL